MRPSRRVGDPPPPAGPASTLLVLAALVLTLGGCTRPAPETSTPTRPPISEPSPASPAAPLYADTGDGSELVAGLPVRGRATAASRRVVYSQQVVLRPGQVLLSVAEFQVTNDLRANVFVGSAILLTTSASAVAGREVTAANGQNVTPAMHHGQQTKNGTYRTTAADAGVRYVNLVVWAAASGAVGDDEIGVDRGYGRLSVLCW